MRAGGEPGMDGGCGSTDIGSCELSSPTGTVKSPDDIGGNVGGNLAVAGEAEAAGGTGFRRTTSILGGAGEREPLRRVVAGAEPVEGGRPEGERRPRSMVF